MICSSVFKPGSPLELIDVPGTTGAFWCGAGYTTRRRTPGGEFEAALGFDDLDTHQFVDMLIDSRRTVAIADFEPWYGPNGRLFGRNREPMCAWLDDVRIQLPVGVKLGCYPMYLVGSRGEFVNRDQANALTPKLLDRLSAAVEDHEPIARRLDLVTPDCYLMGDATWTRDIRYLHLLGALTRGWKKPVCPFIMGAHAPGHDILTIDQARRYWANLKESFDGAVIWGPETVSRNLIRTLPKRWQ